MEFDDFKEDKQINEWFEAGDFEENSKKTYLRGMHYYVEFCNMTPTELIEEAYGDMKNSSLLPSERAIKGHINGFRIELKDPNSNVRIKEGDNKNHHSKSDIGKGSVLSYMTSVFSFYRYHDVEIPQSAKGRNKNVDSPHVNKKIPDRKDILTMIDYVTDNRDLAIILLGATSGLASEEIVNLKVSDFLNGYDEKTGITTFSNILRTKNKYIFTTFCSPFCSEIIHKYLNERNNPNVKNSDRIKNIKIKKRTNDGKFDDEYLFIRKNIPDIYVKTLNEKYRKISYDVVREVYVDVRELLIGSGKDGDWHLMQSHKMRGSFNNMLYEVGANGAYIEHMMAHRQTKTKAAYREFDVDKMKEMYLKHLPTLELRDVEVHTIEDEDYMKLKAEIHAQEQIAELNQQEIMDLKAQNETQNEAQILMMADIDALHKNNENMERYENETIKNTRTHNVSLFKENNELKRKLKELKAE